MHPCRKSHEKSPLPVRDNGFHIKTESYANEIEQHIGLLLRVSSRQYLRTRLLQNINIKNYYPKDRILARTLLRSVEVMTSQLNH